MDNVNNNINTKSYLRNISFHDSVIIDLNIWKFGLVRYKVFSFLHAICYAVIVWSDNDTTLVLVASSRTPWINQYQNVKLFWILLQQEIREVVAVTAITFKTGKVPVKSPSSTFQHSVVY